MFNVRSQRQKTFTRNNLKYKTNNVTFTVKQPYSKHFSIIIPFLWLRKHSLIDSAYCMCLSRLFKQAYSLEIFTLGI